MSILPTSRPQITHLECLNILGGHGVTAPLALLGLRGYYADSFGKPGINDRMVYDDCIALVGSQVFLTVNANTDPNGFRAGHGDSEQFKGMAMLKEGVWHFQKGKHKNKYWAFVQAEDFTVYRDADKSVKNPIITPEGWPVYEDTGQFGIHFHYAWDYTTSSLGCQTVPQEQYEPLRDLAYSLMERYQMKRIPYCLTRR